MPSFGLTREEIPELEDAIAAAREEGVDDLWTWGYEACAHMTSLATPDSPLVWEAVSAALTGRPQSPTEASADRFADLEARSTRELVSLLNDEDATVAGAVAEAGDELAAAIDAIAERLARGAGGSSTSAPERPAGSRALDAAECGPTFGAAPEVVAVFVDGDGCARTTRRAARPICARSALGADDAVVAVSASGATPYTLAALAARSGRGALRVAVVCARGSALAAAAEHEVAAVVGPEIDRRLDAAQGGHGAEARAERDLDA